MAKYKYPEGKDYISGFGVGSGYELACQNMVVAGMEWFDNNPDADPSYRGMEGVYGICIDNNGDAESLSDAIVAVNPGCSGAQHQASISHIFKAREVGWQEYLRLLEERDE